MEAIKLSGYVRADRQLHVQLPANTPLGLVDILILPKNEPQAEITIAQLELWANRRKLLRKQLLAGRTRKKVYSTPRNYVPLSDEERMALVTLPMGTPSTDKLIDEDRGPH